MLEVIRRARFLDPKLFVAFAAAAEFENFTRAAHAVAMTQSGVSQHVARLEEQVGCNLFRRIGNRVVLTGAGTALMKYLQTHLLDLDRFLDCLQTDDEALAGVVSYAMPPSCLFSPHFGELLAKRVTQRHLRLKVTLASPTDVLEMIQQSAVDFGFVTLRTENPSVVFESYCDEEYVFVSADSKLASSMQPHQLFDQQLITYPGADVYYNMWIRHHLPAEKRDWHSLMRSGEINSLDGAISMVVGRLGHGVFPRHCVQSQLASGALFELHASPLLNTIYIARLMESNPPRRVTQVIDWFFEMVGKGAGGGCASAQS